LGKSERSARQKQPYSSADPKNGFSGRQNLSPVSGLRLGPLTDFAWIMCLVCHSKSIRISGAFHSNNIAIPEASHAAGRRAAGPQAKFRCSCF
jgi:hypothetical protein